MGDPHEGHLAGHEEGRHALDQEILEEPCLGHPKLGEGVVVDGHPAADPAVRVVLLAQAVERPGAADAIERRVQPEGDEDGRIDRRSPGVALDRADTLTEGGQIARLDEGPHEARNVVGGQEALEVRRAQGELVPVRALQARASPAFGLGRNGVGGWKVEQLVHAGIVAAPAVPGNPPAAISSQMPAGLRARSRRREKQLGGQDQRSEILGVVNPFHRWTRAPGGITVCCLPSGREHARQLLRTMGASWSPELEAGEPWSLCIELAPGLTSASDRSPSA